MRKFSKLTQFVRVLNFCKCTYIQKYNNNKQPSIQLGIDYKRYMNSDMCDIIFYNMAEYRCHCNVYIHIQRFYDIPWKLYI